MHVQRFGAVLAKGRQSPVLPNIGAVAAEFAELNIVEMRFGSVFEDNTRFMLIAIKPSHAARQLVPDREILNLQAQAASSEEQLLQVAAVHKNINQNAEC